MNELGAAKMLDLVNDAPHEYSGKVIIIGDCPYMLGDPIGSGTEKYVHPLRNMQTGLFHHVLKIHRGAEAHRSLEQVLFLMERLKGELGSTGRYTGPGEEGMIWPDIMPVKWPGGQMHIQVNVGPREPEGTSARTTLLKANDLYKRERWDEAASALKGVFAKNPNHSDAISLLGDIRAAKNDQEGAFACMLKAVDLEPNFRAYYCRAIEYALQLHQFRRVVKLYDSLTSRYPYDRDHDGAALIAYCGMGLPEKALVIRHEREMNTDRIREMDGFIENEIRSKNQAAGLVYEEKESARVRARRQDDIDTSVSRLADALNKHENDPLVQVNLGLALAWSGDAETGLGMMWEAMPALPQELAETRALANCGYVLIREQRFADGLDLISEALRRQADSRGRLTVDAFTNVLISRWVNGNAVWAATDAENSASLLRRAFAEMSTNRADSDLLRRLINHCEAQLDPTLEEDLEDELSHHQQSMQTAIAVAAWEPVISAISAARQGNADAGDALMRELAEWEEVPGAQVLASTLRRIHNGAHDRSTLAELDDVDFAVAARCLDVITGREQAFKELWKAMRYAPVIGYMVAALQAHVLPEKQRTAREAQARTALAQLETRDGWSDLARFLLTFLDGRTIPESAEELSDPVHRDFVAVVKKYGRDTVALG